MFVCRACYRTASRHAGACECGAPRVAIDDEALAEIEIRVGEKYNRLLGRFAIIVGVVAGLMSVAIGVVCMSAVPSYFYHVNRDGIPTPRSSPFLLLWFVLFIVGGLVLPKPKRPGEAVADRLRFVGCAVEH